MKKVLILLLLLIVALPSWSQKKFKGLKTSEDKLTQTIFYETPYTSFDFVPYIGVKRGDVYLRLRLRYTGDDWIFFNKVYLKSDVTELKEIKFDDSKKKDRVSGGYVSETIDVYVDDDLLTYLRDLAKTTTRGNIFFSGDGRGDGCIGKYEIKYLNTILSAYDELRKENNLQGGTEQPSQDFLSSIKSMQWGIPASEVKKTMASDPLIDSEKSLVYSVTCCGEDGALSYNFEDGKLSDILLLFTIGESKLKPTFDRVAEELTLKYYGLCSSYDDANSIWLTDTTKIALILMGKNLSLWYRPLSK